MKRSITLSLTALLLSASAVAATVQNYRSDAFGAPAIQLTQKDIELHTNTQFDQIDTDQDGAICVDEFAAQAVVLPTLARFNKALTIDGTETVHITLPDYGVKRFSASQKLVMDSKARAEYYLISGNDGLLSKQEWTAYQLQGFEINDRNGDGILRKNELKAYSLQKVAYLSHLS